MVWWPDPGFSSRTLSYAYQDSTYDDDENLISPFANPFYADDYPYTEGKGYFFLYFLPLVHISWRHVLSYVYSLVTTITKHLIKMRKLSQF